MSLAVIKKYATPKCKNFGREIKLIVIPPTVSTAVHTVIKDEGTIHKEIHQI